MTQFFARRRRAVYVTAGLGVAALAGTGGYLATSAVSAGSTASAATAATINSAMNSTASPSASSPAAKSHHRGTSALNRLRRVGGMYGEVAYHGKDGTKTLAFERGTVTSAGRDLVVKAANGTTMTWTYVSDTAVRQDGRKVSRSALTSGEHVLVAGPVTSGNHDARVIIVAKATSSGSGSSPSSSAGTSSS